MKLYRAMKVAADGLPEVGRSKRALGVRLGDQAPNNDVDAVAADDIVPPGVRGMSASPADPTHLPGFLRPPAFGGTGKDPVWVMDTADLPPGLVFRQDKPTHGMVEPSPGVPTTLAEYEAALFSTRTHWRLATPPGGDQS